MPCSPWHLEIRSDPILESTNGDAMDFDKTPRKLWQHPNPKGTAMWRFMQDANRRHGLALDNFHDLFKWSCDNRSDFYGQLWDTQRSIHEGSYTQVVDESIPVSQLPRWFEGIRLNWTENLLWSRGPGDSPVGERTTLHKEDDKIALTEVREGNTEVRNVTWRELRARVAALAAAMHARGVGKGDRVVAVAGHGLETAVAFLATTWLGAVFSSSSTDMGVAGLLQRTTQIDPKFVFFDDGALYNGKVLDLREKIQGMVDGMKDCPSFEAVVVIQRFAGKPYETSSIPKTERLEQFLQAGARLTSPPPIVRVGFQDPMVVYYSSGTTGIPKAIVHGVGPLLMVCQKEGGLHRDLGPDDVHLQYTTTGWVMYMASIAHMILGGRAVLYDGSPFLPGPDVLVRICEEQRVTILGISPRWMTELMKREVVPQKRADLSRLRLVTSTGMVLPDQMFDWFYDVAFPKHVQLGNMSGGTDIAGCFVIENPLEPLYAGGCMGGSLGVPISIFDHDLPEGSRGVELPHGSAGDLVSTGAFPNVPLFLWGDTQPTPGKKYTGSYFGRFEGVWAQGDFCAVHPKTRGILMLGRSDGVLNPSGVRFGSSDIYAVLERCFVAEVADSLCVGQRREKDLDERVVLFVIMRPGKKFDAALVAKIKDTIAREMTKRHVPKYIFEAPEIPVTVNGKKVELPVKSIISGKTSLDFFYQFQKIEEVAPPQAKL
ncbi:acetoacetyl-CoA synthase [Purpureocillium lavendulum]|uniref:Acetoacetyl-CoA synthase n=1 Tax=Purpureocillium lavendulum TaxID=1247861 RepID=A0AB34FHW0_9HYPO|nr:acetoacetyl-CoA synthase [Purpureocillium lavendulum]